MQAEVFASRHRKRIAEKTRLKTRQRNHSRAKVLPSAAADVLEHRVSRGKIISDGPVSDTQLCELCLSFGFIFFFLTLSELG